MLSASQGPAGPLAPAHPAGISDAVHSRSASFPLYASAPPSSQPPAPPQQHQQHRQLPPGASYAPDNLHRPHPSLPTRFDSSPAPQHVQPGGSYASSGGAPGPANGLLEPVAEGGSSSGGMSGTGPSPERHYPEQRVEARSAVQQQQGSMSRRPMLLPDPPAPAAISSCALPTSSSSAANLPPTRPALSAPSSYSFPASPVGDVSYPSSSAAPALPATSNTSFSASPLSSNPPPPPLQQRSSFVGIPNGRLPSTRAASDAAERASNSIPAFTPAAAFSPADRGPYPPHVASPSFSRVAQPSPAREREKEGEESELLADSPSAAGGAGGAGGGGGGGARDSLTPFLTTSGDIGRPGSLAFDLPPDGAGPGADGNFAGIGRNSIIRAASLASASASSGAAASPPAPVSAGAGAGASNLSFATQQQQLYGGQRKPSTTSAPSGPKSPQLVGPSLQALQAASAAQQAQPGSSSPSPTPAQQPPAPTAALASPPPPPQQLPPHLVPQPEVCVECMMRDRDMADVDVTTGGVWERESDAEWEEQCRWEAENPPSHLSGVAAGGEGSWSGEHSGSQESGPPGGGARGRRASTAGYSRESLGGRSSNAHGPSGGGERGGRRRFGRGQALTSGNLKVLTAMNPPAAQHRWRTLQTYLATQIHLIELERQAREAAAVSSLPPPAEQYALPRPLDTRPSTLANNQSANRSSSLLSPASLAAEKAAIEHEERQARAAAKAAKTRSRSTLADETNRYSSASLFPPGGASSPVLIAPPQPPFANGSGAASIRSYSAGDQPWLGNQLRRFSSPGLNGAGKPEQAPSSSPPKSPAASLSSARFGFGKFARSTTDLRTTSSPRSVSPSRTSVQFDGDTRRTSMWSRFRQSASASVLSFAPSGSMMDMHLGLSQDKYHLPYGHGHHLGGQYSHGYGGQPGYAASAYDTYPSMSDPAVARHAEQRERDRVLAAAAAKEREGGGDGSSGSLGGGKKKKKGIKGFFNKLVGGGGSKKDHPPSVSAPATPGADVAYGGPPAGALFGGGDDDELAPPPPLSALVNEPRYHQRSASNSSVDSFGPYTPPLHPAANFRASTYTMPPPTTSGPGGGGIAADRQSILTMGSFTSTRSKGRPAVLPSRNSFGRPSLDSLRDPASAAAAAARLGSPEPVVTVVDSAADEPEVLLGGVLGDDPAQHQLSSPVEAAFPHPRLQKSLPSLPSEAMYQPHHSQRPPMPSFDPSSPVQPGYPARPPASHPYAHYGGARSAYSLAQVPSRNGGGGDDFGLNGAGDEEQQRHRSSTVGSASTGRKSRSRAKVFSMNLAGAFGRNKSKADLRAAAAEQEQDQDLPPPVPALVGGAGRANSFDSARMLGGGGGYDARDAQSFRYVR
ncbi:hypothetical protein JCM8097_003920 [Rhodosporidiobolus ruineniae]